MATDRIDFHPLNLRGSIKNSTDAGRVDIDVTQVTGPDDFSAFIYRCLLVEDNDGAPTAYGLDNPNNADTDTLQKDLVPLERNHGQKAGLANAATPNKTFFAGGHDFYWSGICSMTQAEVDDVAKKRQIHIALDTRPELEARIRPGGKGKVKEGDGGYFPVIQRRSNANDAVRGFYVSATAIPARPQLDKWDQKKYWDATVVPYAVWANEWANWTDQWGHTLSLGNVGLAVLIRPNDVQNHPPSTASGYIYADSGTADQVGESSRRLCRDLVGTPDSAILVDNREPVCFIAFPASRTGALDPNGITGRITTTVKDRMAKLAGALNSDDLPLFLALGADLDLFKETVRKLTAGDDVSFPKDRFESALRVLKAWGHPVDLNDLDYHPGPPAPRPDMGDFPVRGRDFSRGKQPAAARPGVARPGASRPGAARTA